MKHALRAVIAVALGAGLAAAAQAQGTQVQGTLNQQSGLSGTSTQSATPPSSMQSAAPATQTQRVASKMRHPSTRQDIRQVQLRLKSEGLYKGRITGVMNPQTRIALTRFEKQHGVPHTASLSRVNRLMAHQTAGAGSSMQRTHMARAPKAPKAQTTGMGSSTPIKQSTGTTPITPPATGMPPASAGGSTSTTGKSTTTTTTVPPATGTTTNR